MFFNIPLFRKITQTTEINEINVKMFLSNGCIFVISEDSLYQIIYIQYFYDAII